MFEHSGYYFVNPKDLEPTEFVLGDCLYVDLKDGGNPICLGPISVESAPEPGGEVAE